MLAPFLPKIPNLEFGFLYSFGRNVSAGRFTADYLIPVNLNADSAVFGEVHAEGQDFWKRASNATVAGGPGALVTTPSANTRVDLSLGGGYRTMLGSSALAGVNGFYDTTRLFDQWYSSGGLGVEFAANVGDYDALDVNLNWNGALFSRDGFVNAFRNNGNSFDLEAGYSHAVLNETMDLRLKVTGYQFHAGHPVRGWRGGADLTKRDRMFTVRYEHGVDPVNGDYNTVGGFVTVGFRLENVLRGESPFTMPEPVFRSPRNLRRLLGLKVKRNWSQPAAVVVARSYQAPTPPAPAPLACPNLQGSILYTTQMNQLVIYPTNPPLPTIATGTVVRVCWCGLQNPIATRFTLYDGQGNQVGNNVNHALNGETGCTDIPMPHNNTGIMINGAACHDTLFFAPGGGISFGVP
jgi:hypothetical protein